MFILTLVILLFSPMANSDSTSSNDREECGESLLGLATCLPYVGGTADAPTPDCCSGLKQVLKSKKKCLCVVIKDRDDPDLGIAINATLALGLPRACNAPANVSQCPALLNLPPDSPEAQIFYQRSANNGSYNSSPDHVPIDNVRPNPTSTAGNRAFVEMSGGGPGYGQWGPGLGVLAGVGAWLWISSLGRN